MVFLGIILAIAAVAIAVAIVADNSAGGSLSLFGHHIPGVSTQAHVFIVGVLVALIFVVGLTIASLALGRSVRVHRELRDLKMEHRESMTTMEMEKRQLERELARARSAASARGDSVPASGRPTTVEGVPRTGAYSPESPFFEQR